jgi:hypothetical protein
MSVARLGFWTLSALGFGVLMVLGSAATFRLDDWDFVVNRSLGDPTSWMIPFNEQWLAVPVVIFRVLFEAVGMHSYLPYLAVLLIAHLATAFAVFRIISRLSGEFPALLAGTVVIFLGVSGENLHHAFQISTVLATACGVLAIDALALRNRPAVAAGLLLVAVASHAIGAVFLGVSVVVAIASERRALPWLILPLAALAAWFVAFDLPHIAARTGAYSSGLAALPTFVPVGITTAFGAIFGLGGLAGAVVLALLACAAAGVARRPENAVIFAAAVAGLVLEYVLITLSRASFGIGSVAWPRYLYAAVPLVLVAVSSWFGRLPHLSARWRPSLAVALFGLGVAAVLGNMRFYVSYREFAFAYVHRSRAAAAIVESFPSAHRPGMDRLFPDPDRLRTLMSRYGSPAHDDLLPFVVREVPRDVAADVCREMLDDPSLLEGCAGVVAREVGGG